MGSRTWVVWGAFLVAVATLAGCGFSTTNDLGEEGNREVGNHNAESVSPIGSEAPRDEIRLILQDSDRIEHSATSVVTDPRRAADHIRDCSGGDSSEFCKLSLCNHCINCTVRLTLAELCGESNTK